MIFDLSVFKEFLICVNILVVDCGFLILFMNGFLVGNDIIFFSIIIFKCDVGFDLIGLFLRCCMVNKIWSGIMLFCKGRIFVFVFV